MPIEDLPEAIEAALAALGSCRSAAGLSIAGGSEALLVTLGDAQFEFEKGHTGDVLTWERLADALPRAVGRARLAAMHVAAGVRFPAPWSVYGTATAVAGLEWALGDRSGTQWRDGIASILAAAECDGDVEIRLAGSPRSEFDASLRSRRLVATIRVGPRIEYIASRATFRTSDVIPDTIAVAGTGRDVGAVVELPWPGRSGVIVDHVSVDAGGTTIHVREPLLPLMAIPAAAMAAVRPGGPAHAPWVSTPEEMDALDAIDAAVHHLL